MSRPVLALLCLSLAACTGNKVPAGLDLTNIVYGGCANDEAGRSHPDSAETAEPETLTVTSSAAGTIDVVHQNVPDECCLDHTIELGEAGTTLSVSYVSKGDPCDCMCSYDYSFTVSGLDPGTWTVEAGSSSATVQVD